MLVDSDRDIPCHLLIVPNATPNPLNLVLECIWMELHIGVIEQKTITLFIILALFISIVLVVLSYTRKIRRTRYRLVIVVNYIYKTFDATAQRPLVWRLSTLQITRRIFRNMFICFQAYAYTTSKLYRSTRNTYARKQKYAFTFAYQNMLSAGPELV